MTIALGDTLTCYCHPISHDVAPPTWVLSISRGGWVFGSGACHTLGVNSATTRVTEQ